MTNFKIQLTGAGLDRTIECPADKTILEAAEEAGIDLPFVCRRGACLTCTGRVLSGTVVQSGRSFLDASQIAAGFILTCISYPTSDASILTHEAISYRAHDPDRPCAQEYIPYVPYEDESSDPEEPSYLTHEEEFSY